jgi:flagellar protein FlbB
MKSVSEKAKVIYLVILLVFIIGIFVAWLDYIGLINMSRAAGLRDQEPASVMETAGDEPSLVAREEFEKSQGKLRERVEDLDKREARIVEAEKNLDAEREKLAEVRKGIELEKKKLDLEQKKYSGYMRNVRVLARQVESIEPNKAVEIIVRWEDTLIIDVLRQIDASAEEAGRMSVTSYLISLMPRNKASRIMYLMTQI